MKRKQPQRSLIAGAGAHKQTICFAAGHSGGHIIPCLTLAQQEYAGSSILFFTSQKPLDCTLIAQSKCALTHIPLAIAQQRKWYTLPLLALSLAWATAQSFFHLIAHMPDRIITTGSIVAVPVCIAGWLLGIPIELFELNAQAGKTIRGLSYISDTVRHCFAITRREFPHNHCIQTPYPIRFSQSKTNELFIPEFTPDRITLFVQGGSQGSQEINSIMQSLIADAPELHKKLQVIHHAGAHWQQIKTMYKNAHMPAHVFSFEADIASFYHAADLVICRAGAGALFEALYFEKRTIVIPLVTRTNNHQLHNARTMAIEYPKLFEIATARNCISIVHAIVNKKVETRQKAVLTL